MATRRSDHGTADRIYEMWARPESIRRFLDRDKAHHLATIDIDNVWWCHNCKTPYALAEDSQNRSKETRVTSTLAKMANIPAFLVIFTTSDEPNPTDTRYPDITSVKLSLIAPRRLQPITQTPTQHANWRLYTHWWHMLRCERTSAKEWGRWEQHWDALVSDGDGLSAFEAFYPNYAP